MQCGTNCKCETKTSLPKSPVQATIEDIEKLLKKEPAANYVADWEIYMFLDLNNDLPFYVSEVHTREEDGTTWFAVAVNKEAYDEWEKDVEHQHHPQEEHPHYLTNH